MIETQDETGSDIKSRNKKERKKEGEGVWQGAYIFKLTDGNDSYLNYCDNGGIEAFFILQLLKERGRKNLPPNTIIRPEVVLMRMLA